MTENIGPINREIPPFAEMKLNGNPITHYMDVFDFPEGEKRKSCEQHLEEDIASEMLDEFDLMGCHFPKPDEEQMIRTAFICPGPSILNKCRLRLVQADADGNILTEGRVTR